MHVDNTPHIFRIQILSQHFVINAILNTTANYLDFFPDFRGWEKEMRTSAELIKCTDNSPCSIFRNSELKLTDYFLVQIMKQLTRAIASLVKV